MSAQPATCYWNKPEQEDEPLVKSTVVAIDEAMDSSDNPRVHLGMSQIGKEDQRILWLNFRWCMPDSIKPRVKRIFRMGDLIETEVISLLSKIPDVTLFERDPDTNEQFRFSFLGGHFGGSMDGCILGIPEAPKTWHVLEVKSVKASRFKELKKTLIKDWSPEYYGQMQCYMGASGMTRALFVAYCKDDSEIYTERVKPEKFYWESIQQKAKRIIEAPCPPESIYTKREDYRVKMMSFDEQAIYWGDITPTKPNCRNCRFSEPLFTENNAAWRCNKFGDLLPEAQQRKGCDCHNWIPELVPAELVGKGDDWTQYKTKDGFEFFNTAKGEPVHAQAYTSKELAHISKLDGLNAEYLDSIDIQAIRTTFEAEIIE